MSKQTAEKTLDEQIRDHQQRMLLEETITRKTNNGIDYWMVNKSVAIEAIERAQRGFPDSQTAEQIRQLAIDFYGDDPHLYGGQRDGYQVGYTAAMHSFASHSPGWIKASERLPEVPNNKRVSILYKDTPHVMVFIDGKWYWDTELSPKSYPIHKDSWAVIEWLNNSKTPEIGGIETDYAQSPAKPEGEGPDFDDLWDKCSEHIDDDSFSFSNVAGSIVITKRGFDKLKQLLTNKQ